MDSFEVNKILGALLGTALLVILIGNVSEMIFHKEPLAANAYPVDVPESDHGGGAEPEEVFDLGLALAEADAGRGETSARGKCSACHTFEEGGPATTGPNLWNVVGRSVASNSGFDYSSSMAEFGGEWTYERLWAYLGNPRDVVRGTAMNFLGLPRESERANVIAYLATLSDSPAPFPEPLPPEEETAEAEAPEDGANAMTEGGETGEETEAPAAEEAAEH